MLSGMRFGDRGRRGPGALKAMVALTVLLGCGANSDQAPQASSVPRRAGEVWVLDSATSRSAAPASMLAYVNGLHVVVFDDGDVYAGTTRLRATRSADGAWELRLPGELEARLTPAGDAMGLAFSTGERIGMHKRQPNGEAR